MELNELIEQIKSNDSFVDFYKLKENILSELAKKEFIEKNKKGREK